MGNALLVHVFVLMSPISSQNQSFHIPCYIFPIKDVDIILGIEWLCSLGSLEADFSKLQHTFTFGNSIITIKGNPTAKPTSATFNQLCHYIAKDGIASFHLLSFESIDPNITLPPRPQK